MRFANLRQIRRGPVAAVLLGTTMLAGGVALGYSAAGAAGGPPPIAVHGAVIQPGFADLVSAVRPAVVNISTTATPKPQQSLQGLGGNDQMNEMLRQFFGPNAQQMLRQRPQSQHALGSGFVIDPAGFIVTNNHVVDDASQIEITLADGSVHPAHLVGRDQKTDLALLKIDAGHPLPYLAFGDSKKARVGDWVIAVGNPFGLGGSVSAGIISANNREINAGPYDDFLQIDAPINPGNSGGPLFDQSGQVIGIDTAIYSPTGGSVGIGFAIPSDVASRVIAQLREHGHVARGWLGVQMQEITPALAKAMGNDQKGVLVDAVTPDSPASHADIKQGDIITAFNGQHTATPRDLAFAVADTHAGQAVSMTVLRDGHERNIDVTVGTEKAQKVAAAAGSEDGGPVGLSLAAIPADQRGALGLDDGQGVVVAQVTPGSPADESGFQPGDVILRIGNRPVSSPAEAASEIHAAEKEKRAALSLLIMRNGTTAFQALNLQDS
ncbi:MAG TPA: DegQ family serine endoprotease [Rhizomicrobium sp.]|jgi:serine protease Do